MYNSDIMYAVMQDRAVQLRSEARAYRQAKPAATKQRRRFIARRHAAA